VVLIFDGGTASYAKACPKINSTLSALSFAWAQIQLLPFLQQSRLKPSLAHKKNTPIKPMSVPSFLPKF
jgi:hypothetical protein